jgi:hypothetical protein
MLYGLRNGSVSKEIMKKWKEIKTRLVLKRSEQWL